MNTGREQARGRAGAHRRRKQRRRFAAAVLLLWICLGCGSDEVRIEVRAPSGGQSAWEPLAWDLLRAEGRRDGAHTRATLVFGGSTNDSLRLDLEVVVDPQATLRSGNWTASLEGKVREGSQVRAPSLRFLGGQGGPPSIGGLFVIGDGRGEQFRIRLPNTPLTVPRE